tara:strand:- start:239 stop:826 length:588 start_codon:yes stop_codon:yes gene_type:complete
MGLLRAGDFFYTLRFLRLLTTPWKKTNAYKEGIIDDNGKVIKKPETSGEKAVYNTFHRLVYNLKRLLNKLPFGRSTIASYAAALFLIKEESNMSDIAMRKVMLEVTGIDIKKTDLTEYTENQWYLTEEGNIQESTYTLTNDIALPSTGEILALKNSKVIVKEHSPIDTVFGISVFEGIHNKTQQKIYITQGDIIR